MNIESCSFEELDIELARREMLEYVRYIWRSKSDEPYSVGRHTVEICSTIDKAIEDYRNGISSFIILTVPPRHGKSEIVSRMLPTRFLGMFPHAESMIVSYSASLAETFSKDGRKIMRSKEFQAVYPGVELAKDNSGVQEWGVTLNGENATGKAQFSGIDGSNTGKGASLIIIDDPLKGREEAESQIIRDKRWESFRSDIITRRAPVSIVIVTLTRWHTDDIVGRIIEQMKQDEDFPRFKLLEWPAVSDEYQWLFPERYSPEYYRSQKSILGSYAWASLYMCNPTPRLGNILRADKVQIVKPDHFRTLTDGLRFARGWDLASGEDTIKEDPDYTSGCKAAVKWLPSKQPGMKIPVLFIAHYERGKWEAMERNSRIVKTALADGNIMVGVEAFGGYKDAYTTVYTTLKGIRSVRKVQLSGNKIAKAEVLSPIFEAGNVIMCQGDWNDAVLDQYKKFPGGAHDDDVDALGVVYSLLQMKTEWT